MFHCGHTANGLYLNEAVEPNQKLAKKILPSGFVKYSDNSYDWSKRGGYSGKKTLEAIIKKAEGLGFKRESGKPSSSADGNHVGNVSKYVNADGVTLSLSSSFGSTKESNNYYASLSFPKKKLSEAKEERKTYSGDEVLSMLHKHVVSSKGQGKFGKDIVNAETGEVLIEGRKTYKALALEFYKAAYENSKKKLTPSTRQTHRSTRCSTTS